MRMRMRVEKGTSDERGDVEGEGGVVTSRNDG